MKDPALYVVNWILSLHYYIYIHVMTTVCVFNSFSVGLEPITAVSGMRRGTGYTMQPLFNLCGYYVQSCTYVTLMSILCFLALGAT